MKTYEIVEVLITRAQFSDIIIITVSKFLFLTCVRNVVCHAKYFAVTGIAETDCKKVAFM